MAHAPPDLYVTGSHARDARRAYWQLLRETLSDDDLTAIRSYLQQQRTLGRDNFRAMVEAKTQRFAAIRPAHRPPRNKKPWEVSLPPF
jgi:putative transposase